VLEGSFDGLRSTLVLVNNAFDDVPLSRQAITKILARENEDVRYQNLPSSRCEEGNFWRMDFDFLFPSVFWWEFLIYPEL
jgi:hypothetical protein